MLLYKNTTIMSSIQLNLRYQKRDQFGSEIFIASNKYDEEKKAFDTLKKLEEN